MVADVATFRTDTTVRVLLMHKSAVVSADRDRVTSAGGTVVSEPADVNGIQAASTTANLRTFVPTAPLDRVVDGHLLGENGLPLCES